jgi:rubrerythrin
MSNQKQIVNILNRTTLQREGAAFVERIANYLDAQHLKVEKYGSWVRQEDDNDHLYYTCSECNYELWGRKSNYCPHCGANMSGG